MTKLGLFQECKVALTININRLQKIILAEKQMKSRQCAKEGERSTQNQENV